MCTRCPLCKTRCKVVAPTGPVNAPVILVGEAPGQEEDRRGTAFCGKAGRELDKLLHFFAAVPRESCRVTNVVGCRPPRNRDPRPEEIEACRYRLEEELRTHTYPLIATLGRFSSNWFLEREVDLEMMHGIPQRTKWGTVLPMYHPAAGLHDSRYMIGLQHDFTALGKIIKGTHPGAPRDPYPHPRYRLHQTLALDRHTMAMDTETTAKGKLWSVQWSECPGEGNMVLGPLSAFRTWNLLLHNALFDLPMLQGGEFRCVRDTMIMAYLLGDEPLGLKKLAYRHCGMKMMSYKEVTRDATREKAVRYLMVALQHTYNDPDPVLYRTVEGAWKVRRPQNISRKIKRILKDAEDPYERWWKIKADEGRRQVEERMGVLERADLGDVYARDKESAVYYACRDADATLRVHWALQARIREYGLEDALDLDMGIVEFVLDCMRNGMLVDRRRLERLSVEFGERMEDIERRIEETAGMYVNPGSNKQVGELLFKRLKLKPKRRTPTGRPSTDANQLAGLHHPVVKDILEWKRLEKVRSTYTTSLAEKAEEDGRVRTRLSITTARTGRLSSSNPNLQNIPVRTKEGKEIRRCFIAQAGCKYLSLDYSAIELRCLAHASQDPLMLEVYRTGGDLHTKTACEIFGSAEHRREAKMTNFALVYGISPPALSEALLQNGASDEWTVDRCKELIKEWFSVYKGVRAYMNDRYQEARLRGYVRWGTGRIRRIPEVHAASRQVAAAGERKAGNAGIQGLAGEIIKKAMIDVVPVYRGFQEMGYTCRPVMQIHDDLMFEVQAAVVMDVYLAVKAVMESSAELSVPLLVDGKQGDNWADMEPINQKEE